MNWIPLTNENDFNDLLELSNQQEVFLFKHSPRCSTSRFALRVFEAECEPCDHLKKYFVNVINAEKISNQIAKVLHVKHESPQAILIRNGKVVYNASHENISAKTLLTMVNPN